MRIAIETWAPEYGSPVQGEMTRPTTETVVDAEVERPRDAWEPIDPPAAVDDPRVLYFIDGVRRIDARVWLIDDDAPARPGACATFAAGAVRCAERAEVVETRIERRLIARAGAPAVESAAGTFSPRPVAEDDVDSLFTALQTDMRSMEARIAKELEKEIGAVVIFDGPLGDGRDVRPAIGYIKSHRVTYLDEGLGRVVSDLDPGQRTPMFLIGERFTRFTWYLRLPGPVGGPWTGVARCECMAEGVDEARCLAELSASTLTRFASSPTKDPRAPQNLYPIAELERELRRRMGDGAYVERALRRAAGA